MRELITAGDIKKAVEARKETIHVKPGTIITPAAQDAATESNIKIIETVAAQRTPPPPTPPAKNTGGEVNITPKLIANIVKEVITSLYGIGQAGMIKESDPSGLRLVKGDTVRYESYNTGKPNDKVGIKKVLSPKESPNLTAGLMVIERTSFSRDMKHEEIIYIIEGALEITVNNTAYHGESGDIFYLPHDTTVIFSTPNKVKLFLVT